MESQNLRNAGLKVTHPRMRILQFLEQSKPRHVTAEDIYRQLLDQGEDIGLATVYRVLTQFEAVGLVLKHNFEAGQSVYELDRGGHHDHMVDVDTGKVIEFENEEIERLQHVIAAQFGYEIEDHSLVREPAASWRAAFPADDQLRVSAVRVSSRHLAGAPPPPALRGSAPHRPACAPVLPRARWRPIAGLRSG